MNVPASRRHGASLWLVAGLTIAVVVAGSAAGLWAEANRPAARPTPTLPAPASRAATALAMAPAGEQPARALLLTLAGARADFIEPYLADGTMRNLALLASSGTVTEYLLGVEPASATVSHISLACGSRPRLTGVVGELYRPAGQALDDPVVAVHGIQPDVPPVWAWKSSDGGSGVAVLFWPGGRGDAAAGAGAELHQDDALTRPQTYTLHPRRLDVEIAGLPASFSPLLAATAPISTPTGARLATLWALLLDGRDDGIAGYDTVWVGLAGDGAAPPAALKPLAAGAWLVVALPGQPATGVALRLVGLGPDAATGSDAWQVTLYQSSLSRVAGSPESLVADLVGRLGPPVPAPDLAGLRAGTLALGDYASLAEQRAQWQMAAIAYVQERMAPRLTLATLDLISLLSWATFKAPAADIYDPPMRSAYREADQALGRLLAGLDLAQTTVFVGTPNGMAAAETALNLEALLDSLVPAPGRTVAAAYSSGGMAHIVLNLAGREPQGTLTREEFDRLVPDLARRLADFKLGERPAFGRVASGAGRRDLGLDHANSGDIVVEAAAGIYLVESDPTGAGRLSWAAPEVVAGYGSARPAMRGIFVLAGRRIANRGIVSPLELVDLAPTLAELVGLHVPAGVEGRVLREMLESEE